MDFYNNKNLFVGFNDEERQTSQSPSRPRNIITSYHSSREMSDQQLQFSPPRSSTSSILHHTSPGSPWTLSPLHTPSPSLLYHCVASLHRREGNVYSIAISKGLIFTGSSSTRIHAWRHPDYAERGYLKASSGQVRAMIAHGHTLFSAHEDHRIRAWTFSVSNNFRAKKLCTLPKRSPFPFFPNRNSQHEDCISCMAYYNGEGLLYTGSYDKTVKVWRISEKKCVDAFVAHEDHISAIVVNQDDGCLFTCSFDGSVKIWRRVFGENSHTLTMTLKFHESPANALALSTPISSNCFLYSGYSDGTINFWEKEKFSGRFNHGGFLHGHRFAVLCLTATEKLLFSGSEDTTIRVWRREEGSCFHECLAVMEGHRGPVKCIAACMEMEKVVMGFLVYSAGLDQTVKVWRIKVLPEEKLQLDSMERSDSSKLSNTLMEHHEISPVLSPSWVERKSGEEMRVMICLENIFVNYNKLKGVLS